MDLHTRFRNSRTRVAALAAFVLAVGLVTVPTMPASAADPVHQFLVEASPASVVAGTPTSLTVTAQDASGNTVTDYLGTVTFTIVDPQVGETAPDSYEFQAEDNGVAAIPTNLLLTRAGNRTVTATDDSDGTVTGDGVVDVTAGDPDHLRFSVQPSSPTYSHHVLTAVVVHIEDAYNNLTASTDTLSMSLTPETLAAGTPRDAVAGVATFDDLRIDVPGNGYTLVASDDDSESVTDAPSNPFNVSAHADLAVTVSASPDGTGATPAIAGTDETYHVKVTNGGPDINSTYSVSAAIPDGTTYVSSSGGCSGTAPVVCSGASLGNGEFDTYDVTVHIPSGYAGSDNVESLSFTSTVTATDPTQAPDDVLANNSAIATFDVIAQADLKVALQSTPSSTPLVAGADSVTYKISVTNEGPSDNNGFDVRLPIPSNTSISGSLPSACNLTDHPGNVTCQSTALFSPGSAALTYQFTYDLGPSFANSAPALGVPLNPQAHVYPASPTDQGANVNTDTANASLTVFGKADLNFLADTVTTALPSNTLYASATATPAQSTVTYEMSFTNIGPSDAVGVQLTALTNALAGPTPKLVDARYCTNLGATCAPTASSPSFTGSLSLGTVAKNATVFVVVKARANSTLLGGPILIASVSPTFLNRSTVSSTTPDPGPNTNVKDPATVTILTLPGTPTNPAASPGNGNAFFRWSPPANNGGDPITEYQVTVKEGATLIQQFTVTTATANTCGTSNANNLCTNVTGLSNGPPSHTYSFTVSARNVVGYGAATAPVTATPSIDASAKQISNGGSQNTGNGNTSTADKQVFAQDFGSGYFGIGTIQEATVSNFCGGSGCIGKVGVTKLLDETKGAGVYKITLLYDKTLIGGTGQKYQAYYLADDATDGVGPTTGTPLTTCNKTFSNFPCSVIKLGNQGANPALKIDIYTKDVDPTTGGKILK